jgi:hypothetical protein
VQLDERLKQPLARRDLPFARRRGGGPQSPEGRARASLNAIKHGGYVTARSAGLDYQETLDELVDGIPAWVECTIHRRDRRVPTAVREYLCEVRGTSRAWITHPRRMLRHKAMVQCARVAFGLSDIVDTDETFGVAGQNKLLNESLDSTPPPYVSSHRPVNVTQLKEILLTKEASYKTD